MDYFKVFGCVGYVHNPDQKRKKLDDKSTKCILLGVCSGTKAYRLYNPATKKVVVSRDVVFSEDENWQWTSKEVEDQERTLKWGDEEEIEPRNEGERADSVTPTAATSTNREATPAATDQEARPVAISSAAAPDRETRPVAEDNQVNIDEDVDSPEDTENERLSSQRTSQPQGRIHRKPMWMADHVTGEGLFEDDEVQNMILYTEAGDPNSFEEAVMSPKWKEAMECEIQAIEKNRTWKLVNLPEGAKAIGVKWLYKTKLNERGEVEKLKARLVALGYAQKHGVDYKEVFAPVARWDTIRMILAMATVNNWQVFQLDVKSAFLHGELEEDVYIEQPKGYEQKGEEEKVLKLRKALYGLKQAPRAWYSRIEAYFVKEGFQKCPSEYTLFAKIQKEGRILIVSIYVDDLIFTGNDEDFINEFKVSMKNEFDMTDLGKIKYFLGVEVIQNNKGIYMSQRMYAQEILQRFGIENSNPTKTPIVSGCKMIKDEGGIKVDSTKYKQMIESLMYLTVSRPDLMYVMSLVSKYMEKPTELHMQAVKRVLRYLRGATELGICY